MPNLKREPRSSDFPTPWQRIMRAYYKGVGLRLTADEIGQLALDGAIETTAAHHEEDEKEFKDKNRGVKANV